MGNTKMAEAGVLLILMVLLLLFMGLMLIVVCLRNRRDQKERERVEKELISAKTAGEIFERVIPGEFLKLLKVKDYSGLTVGAQEYFSAVILDVNRADFSDTIHDRKTEDVFASINGMLGQAIPIIRGQGGLIDSFERGGISAFFKDRCAQALTAAVSLCEAVNAGGKEEYASVAAGLTEGSVMIGVVGHEERINLLLLSEAKEFAGFLREVGYRYYARILVTKELLDSMGEEALRFNSRILGKIHIRSRNASVVVCDVFDGDRVEIRNKKRRTRIVFEKGVELFWEGKLLKARQHFVEVLKLDTADRAASFYLLRCDACLNEEETWQEYMETY